MIDSRKALKVVYGQIVVLGGFGVGLSLFSSFRPDFFESFPWAPGFAVVLSALNIYAYLRRYEKSLGVNSANKQMNADQ